MNVFQSIAILVVLQGAALVGCSSIDEINDHVNSFDYCPDNGDNGFKLMSSSDCGDCEDYAYTKCIALKRAEPDAKTYFLYRNGGKVSHVALMTKGLVLDNEHSNTYKYIQSEWDLAIDWDCKLIKEG